MEEKKLNLKPFDLEAAKQGKPVCTRNGRKARIVCTNRKHLYPIVALIECGDGEEMIAAYSNEGKTEIYETKGEDLMMLPEKHEGWVNVFKTSIVSYNVGCLYSTKEEAISHVDKGDDNYIATVKIEWEE